MICPDFEKWGQSPTEILKLSLEAEYKRTRERFQALYIIGTGQANATQWAQVTGRQNVTVINWVHSYNAKAPAGMVYRSSGGHAPLEAKWGNIQPWANGGRQVYTQTPKNKYLDYRKSSNYWLDCWYIELFCKLGIP